MDVYSSLATFNVATTVFVNSIVDLNQTLPDHRSPLTSVTTVSAYPEWYLSNLTLEYVFDLGPKRDSLTSVIPITVIYVLILITGLVGNVCTCVVITKNKSMHTATNYYLFSLAISDLLLLVLGLPQELYHLWNKYPYVFGEAFCIIRGFTSETSTNASILTITSFTMERYLAICHPLRAQTMSKLCRAVKFIVFVWIFGALCAVPLAAQFGIVFKVYEDEVVDETAECTLKRPLPHAFEISTFFFFILPMTVISVLYIQIGFQLRRSSAMNRRPSTEGSSAAEDHSHFSSANGRCVSGTRRQLLPSPGSNAGRHPSKIISNRTHSSRSLRGMNSSRRAVIKMLFAVVVAFFLCWAPFHAQRLLAIYVTNPTPTDVMMYTVLTYISGVTYYVSATINPILYSIMSLKFREAFKDTLAHCCSGSGSLRRPARFVYSSYPNSTIRSTGGYDGTELSVVSDSPRHRADSVGNRRRVAENGKTLIVSKREDETDFTKISDQVQVNGKRNTSNWDCNDSVKISTHVLRVDNSV